MQQSYLALDLGAESGRAVMGKWDGKALILEDVHRFPTGGTRLPDGMHWDVLRLFDGCKKGLGMASSGGTELAAVGIDTWGVDFGLLDANDELLANPRHYRDHANDGMVELADSILGRDRIYTATGIQIMQINSLFQLLALKQKRPALLQSAKTLLFIPDLLKFWLTGQKSTEYSIASTSQMLDPHTRNWSGSLLESLGLPTGIISPPVMPGSVSGSVSSDVAAECGCASIPFISVGEHDTASAVAAVPADSEDFIFLSSGTWSLLGIELSAPLVNSESQKRNFTNEGGVFNTIRLLKNVMGLWLVQECRRSFAINGRDISYSELTEMAKKSAPFRSFIDPDHHAFLAPFNMVQAISQFCKDTGQPIPDSEGAFIRCCVESLVLKYRTVIEELEILRGNSLHVIHVVGGGTQNRLLCQLTADATRREVVAGPVEATAAGNILMQAVGMGEISTLRDVRAIVRKSFSLDTYHPEGSSDAWNEAYSRFQLICN